MFTIRGNRTRGSKAYTKSCAVTSETVPRWRQSQKPARLSFLDLGRQETIYRETLTGRSLPPNDPVQHGYNTRGPTRCAFVFFLVFFERQIQSFSLPDEP